MTRLLPVSAAVIVLLFSGVVHGLWTDRWAESRDVIAAAARLNDLPMKLGDWEGKAASGSRPSGGLAGAMSRHYVHRPTGRSVTLFLGCGRPGPVSIHTPDVCYAANGYEVTAPARYAPSDLPGHASFWMTEMVRSRAAEESRLRVFFAWGATGEWQAADNPRVAFAGTPVLYKLYVLRDLPAGTQPPADDPCLDFFKRLQPELQKCLFPAAP